MSRPDELTVLRALSVKITIGPRRTGTASPSPGDDPGDHKNDIRTTRDENGTAQRSPALPPKRSPRERHPDS
jgi:hypothetical protein